MDEARDAGERESIVFSEAVKSRMAPQTGGPPVVSGDSADCPLDNFELPVINPSLAIGTDVGTGVRLKFHIPLVACGGIALSGA